jgi:hypothetical protein
MIMRLHGGRSSKCSSHHPKTYPMDISIGSIITICSAVIAESSITFNVSSSLQVAANNLPATYKSARGYRDLKILRVRLTDCFMLAKMISWDQVNRLFNI